MRCVRVCVCVCVCVWIEELSEGLRGHEGGAGALTCACASVGIVGRGCARHQRSGEQCITGKEPLAVGLRCVCVCAGDGQVGGAPCGAGGAHGA
jgi:hypothetical protein